MIHSKILSIYNELELFVQNLFHGITQIYFRHHSPELHVPSLILQLLQLMLNALITNIL